MLARRNWFFHLNAVVLLLPAATVNAQIYTDSDFDAGDYTTSSAGLADIRFGIDYSTIDIFGDSYLTATIPQAPRTMDGSTTGVFLSANNDTTSPEVGAAALAAITPTGVNIGSGTANPNYVMRVDVFHSSGAGYLDDQGNLIPLVGTTNYSHLGINQSNTDVQVLNLNAPGSGNLSGQGLGLSVTADSGAAEDYLPVYGGAAYADREGISTTASQIYTGDHTEDVNTGLAGNHLNNYWLDQGLGFELADSDGDSSNDLNIFTGDALYFSPDPDNTEEFEADGSGVDLSYYAEHFPLTSEPIHYTGGGVPDEELADTNAGGITAGIPSNVWATHELYWVGDEFTYVIDGRPVLQMTPGSENVFDPFSTSGAPLLAFWDRFSSVASSPEGANFVIYDNLEIDTADSSDVPNMMEYLDANGYLLSAAPGGDGDFDGDGDVDGADFLAWQRGDSPDPFSATDLGDWEANFGAAPASALAAVPEPSTMVLLSVAALGLLHGRRQVG